MVRWKPPHTLSMREGLLANRDIVQFELSITLLHNAKISNLSFWPKLICIRLVYIFCLDYDGHTIEQLTSFSYFICIPMDVYAAISVDVVMMDKMAV